MPAPQLDFALLFAIKPMVRAPFSGSRRAEPVRRTPPASRGWAARPPAARRVQSLSLRNLRKLPAMSSVGFGGNFAVRGGDSHATCRRLFPLALPHVGHECAVAIAAQPADGACRGTEG